MAQGDVEARVVADTSGLQAGMVQAAVVTEAQMKRIAQYVNAANDANAKLGKTVQQAASTTASSYSQIAEGAKKVESAHAGVNRELLVLAHEMSQGNYSRFGGSLLVLAERTNALSFAMTAAGAATLGVGALILGAAAEFAMGAIDADRFNKSLQLTGNYAAMTQESLKELAVAQSTQTGQSVSAARASLEAAAGSGLFGPAAVASVARAMGDYQRLTGEAADKALEKFAGLKDGVAKWAEEENRSMHFLTAAEYDHIKALEQSGQAEQAAVETVNLLAGALESRGTPSLGFFARAWAVVAQEAGKAIDAMKDFGRPTDALVAGIAAVDRQMALVRQANTQNPAGASQYLQQLEAERARLEQLQFRANEHRSDASANAAVNESAIAAEKDIDQWRKRAKAADAYADEIKKVRAEFAVKAQAGTPVSRSDQTAIETQIKKDYTPHSEVSQANEYASMTANIKAYNQATAEEAKQTSNLTEAQKWSIDMHKQLETAGKNLSASQRSVLGAMIDTAAADRAITDAQIKDSKERLKVVDEEATRQAEYEKKRYDAVAATVQAGNEQANAIIRQTQLIGKNADEVKRLQDLQKFDDNTAKALVAAPDADAARQVNEVAAAMRTNLVSALDAAKKAQDEYNASFSNGFMKAQQDYVKAAQDHSAQGAKLFNDSVNSMSDAISKFAETGKFNWKSLIDSMLNDIIRLTVNNGMASLLSSGSTGGVAGLLGLFGSGLFSSMPSVATSIANALPGDSLDNLINLTSGFGTMHANGLDYVPYDGYPAILHEGERVLRKQDAKGSSGGHTFDFSGQVVNVGQGVSRADVTQAVTSANAQQEARMRRLLKNGSIAA